MPPFILWLVFLSAWLVWWMVKRKTLDASIGLVVAWAALFTVPFFIPQIGCPLDAEIGLVTTVVMVVFAAYYFHTRDEEEVAPEGPMVSLEGTTRDRVHGVVDETRSKAPLVSDKGGTENKIYDIERREKDENRARRKAQD